MKQKISTLRLNSHAYVRYQSNQSFQTWNPNVSHQFDGFFKSLDLKFCLRFCKTNISPKINSLVSFQISWAEKCWMKQQQRAKVSYSAYEIKTSSYFKTNFRNKGGIQVLPWECKCATSTSLYFRDLCVLRKVQTDTYLDLTQCVRYKYIQIKAECMHFEMEIGSILFAF